MYVKNSKEYAGILQYSITGERDNNSLKTMGSTLTLSLITPNEIQGRNLHQEQFQGGKWKGDTFLARHV